MAAHDYDFDYFVIGGGSGGVRSARIAASHGARVAVAEERHWGGTCVNLGCVPKKMLAMAARYSEQLADAVAFGWEMPTPSHDWPTLIARKDTEIARLNKVYRSLLTKAGCELIDARAALLDAHTIAVGNRTLTADRILVATGGQPVLPVGVTRSSQVFTSDEAFHLPTMPKRVIIVGAGYIAVEFAGIFNGLGADVTVVCRGQHVLRGFDFDLCTRLGDAMAASGITMRLGREVTQIDQRLEGVTARLTDGQTVEADAMLLAIGRSPNTAGVGLEAVGVRLNAEGAILVDEHYASTVPNIFAIGDVTNRVALTPVAIAEGAGSRRKSVR